MFLNLLFSHAWSSSWQLRLLLRRTWFKVATVQIFCARSNCSLSGDQTQLEIGTTSILAIAIVKITVSTKWGENYDLSFSQNNEKVVLVVARRKGNYASSQSTAITGQRDETDGAVPGPQTSGKVTSVHLLLLGWSFYILCRKELCKGE